MRPHVRQALATATLAVAALAVALVSIEIGLRLFWRAFVARRRQTDVPLYHRYDRHWNAAGHALAAEVLYAELERSGLPSGR